MTTDKFAASREKLSLVGPGIGSARSNRSALLLAAKVLRAEQLLHADDLRAVARRLADAPLGLGQVLRWILRAGHLDEADAELRLVHETIVAARLAARRERRGRCVLQPHPPMPQFGCGLGT